MEDGRRREWGGGDEGCACIWRSRLNFRLGVWLFDDARFGFREHDARHRAYYYDDRTAYTGPTRRARVRLALITLTPLLTALTTRYTRPVEPIHNNTRRPPTPIQTRSSRRPCP